MPRSQEPNVVRVRIIVPDDFQPKGHDSEPESVAGGDPNGDQVLEGVMKQGGGRSVAELKRKIAAAARKAEPNLLPHDIVAVGHHPFAVIDGTLVGHLDAEHKGGAVRLSLLRQDVLIWESDRPFIVIVKPVTKEEAAHAHDPATNRHLSASGASDGCPTAPSHPFHRKDHPFVALHSADPDHGRVYRVAAGAVRPDALVQRHYKATILTGSQRLDPDLIIVPD